MNINPVVVPRMDLLSAPSNPTGFIAELVLPSIPVFQWSGSVPMVKVDTSTTASGRSGGAGSTINANTQTANLVPYNLSASEVIDREAIEQAQIAMYGSLEACERALAFTGTLRVRTKIETDVYNLMSTTNPINVTADVYGGVLSAVLLLQPYGQVQISGSAQALNVLRANPNVRDALKFTGAPISLVNDFRSITKNQLAGLFRADRVNEAITNTVIWANNILVVSVIPAPEMMPASFPQVGRNITYTWNMEGGKTVELVCEGKYDTSTNKDVLDFISYKQPVLANAAFTYALTIA